MYKQRLNYIHCNAVTAGFVAEPWHLMYSSSTDYFTEKMWLLYIIFWMVLGVRLVGGKTQDGVLRLTEAIQPATGKKYEQYKKLLEATLLLWRKSN